MPESIPPIGSPTPTGPVLPEAFDQFVGDTFFRQMLKSLRSTTGEPAFLHGGQAEEIFQSQLDELLITDMVKATQDSFSGDLFKQQFPHLASQDSPEPGKNLQSQQKQPETSPSPIEPSSSQSNFDTQI